MRKIFPVISILTLIFAFALGFNVPADNVKTSQPEVEEIAFPEDVLSVMERSCFGCHTDEATNKKAKFKLNFSNWTDMKASKKIGKLSAICEEIAEGEMPPEKFLENYPDRKLTKEEIELVCEWADTEVNNLLGN